MYDALQKNYHLYMMVIQKEPYVKDKVFYYRMDRLPNLKIRTDVDEIWLRGGVVRVNLFTTQLQFRTT